jgi:cytoskeletal protein CcmA (bactofilin family)
VRAADRVEIRKTGSLEGDLVTARIAIEEDAVFRGSIDIVKPGAKQGDSPASTSGGEKAKAAKSS